MATFFLCPISTIFQYFTDVGIVLAGGKLNTYLAGTTTPTPTWTDSTGVTQNGNPIILNAAGRLPNVQVWQQSRVPIKVVVTDAANNQIGPTFDQLSGIGDPGSTVTTFYGGVDTGVANAYILTFTASFGSYVNGLIIYWVPSHSNTGASTININGLGIVNIINQDGSALTSGQLAANQVAVITSQGGNFLLLSSGLSPSLTTGTFTPVWTGFSVSPTGNMTYQIVGDAVTLEWLGSTGTSNATSMTIQNVPTALRPATVGFIGIGSQPTVVVDNGAFAVGTVGFTGLGVMQFNKGTAPPSGTGFTNPGTKGLDSGWSLTYLRK